ncbi:TetR/AcrR family transcriptional regulator [Thermoflavimicrobium daqui]|jgi:AcrR family transcriptional regulator|uniref:TetR/AcrR family transcriptional regulator n=1 Tax=Thermoflavimicrobium daqui TaxID=2137476 RepID=A0A364K1E8_9BACL|nr:TetR/AcrR family transcriptional regulator [Thermoflavimicrobium daqui]RAL21435.1 TetR/AcrR family transcriptional regulator [Thermoflavimicrobium daqui]
MRIDCKKCIDKLLPIIQKKGFNALKIDDVAKYMDISKATLYKYFSSKDEIVEKVVDVYVDCIKNIDQLIVNEEAPFSIRFQRLFEQSMLIAVYISDIFLEDLKTSYPQLLDRITQAQLERSWHLDQFYASGVSQGVFNPIHFKLFMFQDEIMLRKIIQPNFLIPNDLTIKQAIYEYYTLKKLQLFKPEYLEQMDDSLIKGAIHTIVQKLTYPYTT